MNVKWMEKINREDVSFERIFIDKYQFMRLIDIKIQGKHIYIFTPPSQLLNNVNKVERYENFDLGETSKHNFDEVERLLTMVDIKIIERHATYVVAKHHSDHVNMIVNLNEDISKHIETETNPTRVPEMDSYLEEMRLKRRIANYLKFFTLYAYAHTQTPVKYDIAPPDHIYDVQSRNINNSTFITDSYRIIVNDRKLIPRIDQFLQTSLRNSTASVLNFKNKQTVDFFSNVTDLRNTGNREVIFSSIDGAMEYIENNGKSRQVMNKLQPHSMFAGPFYFSDEAVLNGRLCILQPVTTIEQGINTCIEWKSNKRNDINVDHINNLGGIANINHCILNECDIEVSDGQFKTSFITTSGKQGDYYLIMNKAKKHFAVLPIE